MKKITLLLILLPFFIQAQHENQVYVKYKSYTKDEPKNPSYIIELVASPQKSTAKGTLAKGGEFEEIKDKGDDEYEVTRYNGVSDFYENFQDISSPNYYFTQIEEEGAWLVKDSLPDYEWEILEETKEIAGYVCHKATTSFRGSRIVAWFTEDISIPFGPFKFRGLPGVILKVSNPDGPSVSVSEAMEVNYPYNENVSFDPPKILYESITYEKFFKRLMKQLEEEQKEFQEQLSEHSINSKSSEPVYSRPGIEKKYEWEE